MIEKIMWALLGIAIVFGAGMLVLSQMSFPQTAQEKCEKLGLELFDYDSGNIFTESSITCINSTTKEIVKIR